MDQSKLYKAFERNKTQRTQKPEPERQPEAPQTQTRPVLEASDKVLADMLPTEAVLSRTASLTAMRNPNPMTVTDMKKNRLVFPGMKNRAVLNAYRELRIKLRDQSDADNIVVMISSVDARDNSVVTALNLAISFALDVHSSALLVDCNPYGSDLQSVVTSRFDKGITDYISPDQVALQDIIYPSGIERVSVIPAGRQHAGAVEQFSSQAMRDLLYELKNRYSDRFIVINAPPVLASSEARVLAKYCDHTVLTVPYGKASIDSIEDSVAALGSANVSGVVYQQ